MGLKLSCSRSFVSFIFVFVGFSASAFKHLQVSFGDKIISTQCQPNSKHRLCMGSNNVPVYDAVTKKFRLEPVTETNLLPQQINEPVTKIVGFQIAKAKWNKYREIFGKDADAKSFQLQDLISALMDPKQVVEIDNTENNSEDMKDSLEVFVSEEELELFWADQHVHNMRGQTFSTKNALLLLDSENDVDESNEPTAIEFLRFAFPEKKKERGAAATASAAAALLEDVIETEEEQQQPLAEDEPVTITLTELERIWASRSEISFGLPGKKFTPENALLLLDDDEDEADQDEAFGPTQYLEARFISEEDLTEQYFNSLTRVDDNEDDDDQQQQEQHLREVKSFIDLQENVYSPRGNAYDVNGQIFLEPMLWSQSRIDSRVLKEWGESHPYHQLVKKLEPDLYEVAKYARDEDQDPFNQKITPIWEVVGIDKETAIGDLQTIQQYIESQIPVDEWQLPEYLRGIVTNWPKRLNDADEDETYDRYLEEKKMKRPSTDISALLTMLPSTPASNALAAIKSKDVSIALAEAMSDDTMIGDMTKAEFIRDLQRIDELLDERELDVILDSIQADSFSEETLQHRYTYRIPGEDLETNYVQFTDSDPTEEDDLVLTETDPLLQELEYDLYLQDQETEKFASTKKKSPVFDSKTLWEEKGTLDATDERLSGLLQYYEQERKKLSKNNPFDDYDVITGEYFGPTDDDDDEVSDLELKKKIKRAQESASKMIANNLIDEKTANAAITKIISDHKKSFLHTQSAKEKASDIFTRWQELSDPMNKIISVMKSRVAEQHDDEDQALQEFITSKITGLEDDALFQKHLKQWMKVNLNTNDEEDDLNLEDSYDDFQACFTEFVNDYRCGNLPDLPDDIDLDDEDDNEDDDEEEEKEFWRDVLRNGLRSHFSSSSNNNNFIMPEFYPNLEFELRNITNENRNDPEYLSDIDHREIFKYPLDKFFEPFMSVMLRMVKAEVDELEREHYAFLEKQLLKPVKGNKKKQANDDEFSFDDDDESEEEEEDEEDDLRLKLKASAVSTRRKKNKVDIRSSLMTHLQHLIRRYLFKEEDLHYEYPGQIAFQSSDATFHKVWELENAEDPIEVFIVERLKYLKELDHKRRMEEGSLKHRFPRRYFDHPRWKDHVGYESYSQYNPLLFSDEHMNEEDVLTILGLRKFRENTDRYVTNHHDRIAIINTAKANDRFLRAKLHDPAVSYPVKQEIPMYMTPDKNRGIEYTDTIIEMRSKMVLEPKSMKFSDGPYTTNDDVIQTYEGGTFLEVYNPTPTEGVEYVIEKEKVKIIQPAIRYINHMATLQSTKDDVFIFKYHSQMRHLNGARNCMLEMIKNLYPPTKDVRLETTRTQDGFLHTD